jgi:hypothetical protein
MFAASKTSTASSGYQISRSLRFNSADSAYLDRAQTTGSTQKATWSGWVKRSALTIGAFSTLFSAGTANTDTLAWNNTGDTLRFFLNGASSADLVTTQVFRDPSAWYHIVIAIDTTQATAANRILMYINGVQVTAFTTATYPTQNYTFTRLNTSGYSANLGSIGTGSFLSAYMTEVNFVDGQQLAATSFGETNVQTGVWQPKAYSGSYGTNGFYLNFSDNSNTTAATLGKDYSGNGNNWTPNNFSVTAGAGNDSMVDVPTSYGTDTGVGGSVRGNYCTWNPLQVSGVPSFTGAVTRTYTNGNLEIEFGTGSYAGVTATLAIPTSGKWYWEVTASNVSLGISASAAENSSGSEVNLRVDGAGIYSNGSAVQSGLASYGTGDIIGLAWDADTNSMQFYKNGSAYGSAQSYTPTSNVTYYPFIMARTASSTTSGIGNFGQRPFAYTAPSGFKALCTQNLPTPTIGATTATQAGKFFNPVIYTGAGSGQSITGVGFQPDFVWMKRRSAAGSHILQNAVTGVTKGLQTNDSSAEFTDATTLTAFDADGFTAGGNSQTNGSGSTYVAWNWKANGSGSSNTSGSITSTVSASTTSGFSIVTYTGTGANATVGHGLGVAPSFIIVKRRDAGSSWNCYQISLGASQYIQVDGTGAAATNTGVWNNTAPTTTVFSIGTAFAGVNASGSTHVAYCFAEVAGYSKFGTYTGNGSADGPFIYTGFRPAYVMIKASSTTGDWWITDATRNPSNVTNFGLRANLANSEVTDVGQDILSNGFRYKNDTGAPNVSGVTYIYMAFASTPFKYALAR